MTLPQNKSVGQAASGTVSLQVWIILTVMLIFWCVLGSVIAPAARQHDFLNLYTGGTLALRGHFHQIYLPEVQFRAEREFIRELPALVPFVCPPFYAAALSFWPPSRFDLHFGFGLSSKCLFISPFSPGLNLAGALKR